MLPRLSSHFTLAAALLLTLAVSASQTQANLLDPEVEFGDTTDQCEDAPEIPLAGTLVEEIGDSVFFPADERMLRVSFAAQQGDCGIAVGGGNDYRVLLTNTTGRNLQDVYVVVDSATTFDNWDASSPPTARSF